jgi:hypothetical protein
LLAPALIFGQALNLDSLDKLKSRASENVSISMDSSLLRLASKFLSDDDPEEAEVRKLVAGLKRIVIRSFEFQREGEYLDADVDAIRNQLRDPAWKKVIEVHSRKDGESADVFLRQEADRITAVALIMAEPKELTVIHIEGPIDLDGLAKLAGNFGIPESVKKGVEKKTK